MMLVAALGLLISIMGGILLHAKSSQEGLLRRGL